MACYLIANGGNWTDTTKWAASDADAATNTNSGATPTASDDVFLTANSGQCTISATSVGKSLTCTGYTNTLTHNNFILTIQNDITLVAGMTYIPPASSTTNLRMNAAGTLTTGGKAIGSFEQTSNAAFTLGDNLTFQARVDQQLVLGTGGSASFDMNGKSINGNSATNRILIRTTTLSSQKTITNMSTSFTYADFKDIAPASGTVDLSAITGNSGDCGGNSTNITFTTAINPNTITGNSVSLSGSAAQWSDVGNTIHRVPLPQDTTVINMTAGQTLTVDMPRIGKDLSFTTATNFTLSNAITSYGSVDFTNMGTLTDGTNAWTFESQARSGSLTLTSAGKSFNGGKFITVSTVGATFNLGDAFSGTGGCSLQLTNGTLNTKGFSYTGNVFQDSGSATRAINFGSSIITVTRSTAGSVFILTSSGMTFNAGTSTIVISDTGANNKTFAGGGLTYNNLQFYGTGAGAIIFTGANTFNRIYTDGGGTKTITLPGSTTTTILSGLGLNNGTNLITFTASAGSATISHPPGNLAWDYVSLTNIISTGGGTFYAGPLTHSTDGGGNTGWIFDTAPPDGGVTSSYNNLLLYFFQ